MPPFVAQKLSHQMRCLRYFNFEENATNAHVSRQRRASANPQVLGLHFFRHSIRKLFIESVSSDIWHLVAFEVTQEK